VKSEKKGFFQFPKDNLGNSTLRGWYLIMKNKIKKNNGVLLLQNSQIEVSKKLTQFVINVK
jgi:hypothetical protein